MECGFTDLFLKERKKKHILNLSFQVEYKKKERRMELGRELRKAQKFLIIQVV